MDIMAITWFILKIIGMGILIVFAAGVLIVLIKCIAAVMKELNKK